MRKLYFLKTIILLCALIAGSSAWAANQEATLDMTSSQTSPVVVNGVTFTWTSSYIVTGASSVASNGFCGKNGTADMVITIPAGATLVGISKVNGNNWGSTNINVYTGTNSNGTLVAEISQSPNSYTISSNNTGSSYYLVTSASKNAWLRSLTITYTPSSFTITTAVNNSSMGSAVLNGTTITATPNSGFRVKSGDAGYTVTDGTASVTNNGDNTFTVTASTNCTVQINFEAIPTHTLTASANNVTYGSSEADETTILEGATTNITATAYNGYRFVSWTVEGAGSSVADATANPTTFTMGTANATVTANFEAIPTHTLSSAIMPANSGSVVLGATSVREGSQTTATATPNEGYIFKNWTIFGEGSSIDDDTANPATVTMGTADATVTANFVAIYTIEWSVNGQVVKTMGNVEQDTELSSEFPAVANRGGKVFRGWVTSSTFAADFNENGLVDASKEKATANITYYAVFAKAEGSIGAATLTNTEITSNITNTTCAYGTAKTYTDTSDGVTWVASCYTDTNSRPWMQLKKDASAYLKITAPKTITEVKLTITSATNSSGGITDISKHTAFSGTVYLDTSAKSNPNGGKGSSNTVSSNTVTVTPTGTESELYVQVSSGARVWGVEITYNNIEYSDYCTTITATTPVVTAAGWATYVAAYDMEFAEGDAFAVTSVDTKVNMTSVTQVPAGTPLLLKGAGAKTAAVLNEAPAAVTNKLAVSDGTNGVDDYVLANPTNMSVGFYKWTGSALAAGKVYLPASEVPANAREFIGFDDVTAVESMKASPAIEGTYYNLKGQQVAQPTKGLYIVNGKKVIKN